MIDTNALRVKLLDLATSGKLSVYKEDDESVNKLLKKLPKASNKRKKLLNQSYEYDGVFEIPEHWTWVKLGEITSYGDTPTKVMPKDADAETWILELEDIESGGKLIEKKRIEDKVSSGEKTAFKKGQVLYSKLRPYLKKVLVADEDGISTPELIASDIFANIDPQYVVYCLTNSYVDRVINKRSYGVKMPRVDAGFMVNLPIPLPPVQEQQRIVSVVEESTAQISIIDELQSAYSSDLEALKSKIIDAGIQGKLTEQLPEDGTAEDLYAATQGEIEEAEKTLEIPDNWKWIKLGWTVDIERGGSPRPIKAYMTDSEDGINWIKIGDVAKDGKYITQTKEKIKPEGERGSRKVVPGDFLLTNSMSFGRPYISKIYGCIHDGWLLLRNSKDIFDLDYLYYLLSSKYAYNQFCKKASGSTVDNLNKEKVASAVIPLPPISEQKRIADAIENTISMIK